MKKLLFWISIYFFIVAAFDRFVIKKLPYVKYLDSVEIGFELNKLAGTLSLEGLRLFIGLIPFFVFGGILFYLMNLKKSNFIESSVTYFNFFILLIVLNIVGGIVYFICTLIPYINSVNDFFSKLILIRIYLNFPFLKDFDYANCYIDFYIVYPIHRCTC